MLEIGPAERRHPNDIASLEHYSGELSIDRVTQSVTLNNGFARVGIEPGKSVRVGPGNGTVEVYFYEPEPKGLWRRLRAAWRALTK